MNKFFILATAGVISGFSALSPLHQSIKEIDQILTNPDLPEHLPSQARINEITRIKDGYLIVTDSHVLKVKVEYKKTSKIGPKKFTINFCDATSIKD